MRESDFNEHTIPPQGWQFRQPEFGNWTVQNPVSKTLNQVVMEVLAARKKNLAITSKFKLSTSPEMVKTEVIRFNRKRLGLNPDGAPIPFRESHRSFAQGAVGAVAGSVVDAMAGLKRAASGTAVVIDWLTSGGAPVAQELANKRAAVCVACPKNVAGAWFTTAPAELIKKTLEARKDLKLETPHDAALKSCDVCRCLMRLKVHTPLEFILAKTKPEIMSEFPAHCWIAKRDQT